MPSNNSLLLLRSAGNMAAAMIRSGRDPASAIRIAASKFRISASELAAHVGGRGAKKRGASWTKEHS